MKQRLIVKFEVDQELDQIIRQVAAEQGFSRSDAARHLVRKGYRQYLEEQRILSEHEPIIRRAS